MFKARKHILQGKKISEGHEVIRSEKVWISSNGRETLLKDMDKNHLQNAINKIIRGELESRVDSLPVLNDELTYRINNPK